MIYGLHDLSEHGANLMGNGWLVDAVAVWHDPTDVSGADYRPWTDRGCTVICRLNNGWNPRGTIPLPEYYDQFAQRCANFVGASQGCHIWIVGNEWNLEIERPWGRLITIERYADCYSRVRKAIKSVAPDDWVVPAAIGPWNVDSGDWLVLYKETLQAVDADAICWHVYSHGYDPALVTDDTKMATHPNRYYNFRCYRDFEKWTPADKRHLPVLVTEANGNGPWHATGWIPAAYREIQQSTMDVCCMCLFRAARTGDGYGLTDAAWAEFEQTIAGDDGGDEMDKWQIMHMDGLELPFYDQDGIGELTLPPGYRVKWDTSLARPEMDAKIAPQPEVYPDGGKQSAVGFLPYKMFRWWAYTTREINVAAGRRTRRSAQVMIVSHGIKGDNSKSGACGMRVGIGPRGVDDPFSPDVVWSDWWVVRGSLDNERIWHKLTTPEFLPATSQLRLWIQCNADVAAAISAGHWDMDIVEQYVEEGTPQPPSGGVTEERVIELINEYGTKLISGMVPGMIKMHAPGMIAEKLLETCCE
jgi:hypothetical protein